MSLYYDHYLSPVGSLVLAATDDGLCCIAFVGGKDTAAVDEAALERALYRHLPPEIQDMLPGPANARRAAPRPATRGLVTPEHTTPGHTTPKRAPQRLVPARRWLDRYFAGQPLDAEALEMPLDLSGTPFQLKVWKQLARIPYGRTLSYGDIAKCMRQPGAARAVGMANNRNPLPILIPCHRVVGADGKLVGYGGGLWRKKALLRLEEGDLFESL